MWGKITAIILFTSAIIGSVWLLEDRNETKFARANDLVSTKVLLADSLKQVNQSIGQTNIRIQQHTLQDRVTYIKREMQEIRVDCKTNEPYRMPNDARKRYNDFQIQLDQINLEMQSLGKK